MNRTLFSVCLLLVPDPIGGGGTITPPKEDVDAPENPKQVTKLQKQLDALQEQLAAANSQLEEAQNLIDGKNREMTGLIDDVKSKDEQIVKLTKALEKGVGKSGRVAELEAQLEKLQASEAQRIADEKAIIEKMTHGLSRSQAVSVINRQKAYDEAKEKSKAPAKPAAKK